MGRSVFHVSRDLAHAYHVTAVMQGTEALFMYSNNMDCGFVPFSVPEVFRGCFLLA